MIVNNTPVETYELNGVPILVKREDLCCPFPGPSFSKIRGVAAHIKNRPESVIGGLDTSHSKAGWAVAYVCRALGKQCVDYWRSFKKAPPRDLTPRFPHQQAAELGATLVDLPARRSAILYRHARKRLAANYPGSYLM